MYNPICEVEDSLHESINKLKAIADLLVAQSDSVKETTLYGVSRIMTDELARMDERTSRLTVIRRTSDT